MKNLWDWLIENKQWIFSGIGVFVLTIIWNKFNKKTSILKVTKQREVAKKLWKGLYNASTLSLYNELNNYLNENKAYLEPDLYKDAKRAVDMAIDLLVDEKVGNNWNHDKIIKLTTELPNLKKQIGEKITKIINYPAAELRGM